MYFFQRLDTVIYKCITILLKIGLGATTQRYIVLKCAAKLCPFTNLLVSISGNCCVLLVERNANGSGVGTSDSQLRESGFESWATVLKL